MIPSEYKCGRRDDVTVIADYLRQPLLIQGSHGIPGVTLKEDPSVPELDTAKEV